MKGLTPAQINKYRSSLILIGRLFYSEALVRTGSRYKLMQFMGGLDTEELADASVELQHATLGFTLDPVGVQVNGIDRKAKRKLSPDLARKYEAILLEIGRHLFEAALKTISEQSNLTMIMDLIPTEEERDQCDQLLMETFGSILRDPRATTVTKKNPMCAGDFAGWVSET